MPTNLCCAQQPRVSLLQSESAAPCHCRCDSVRVRYVHPVLRPVCWLPTCSSCGIPQTEAMPIAGGPVAVRAVAALVFARAACEATCRNAAIETTLPSDLAVRLCQYIHAAA